MKYGTITAKGQTTVPKDVRDKLKLKPGDKVYWIVENGKAVLRPKNGSIMDLAGMFYDPNRKPMTIEELQEAIGDAVAEGVIGELTHR
jgi:AbrB family looped-hinge helix DNA binding protein